MFKQDGVLHSSFRAAFPFLMRDVQRAPGGRGPCWGGSQCQQPRGATRGVTALLGCCLSILHSVLPGRVWVWP